MLAGGALGVVFGDIGTSPLYTLKRYCCYPAIVHSRCHSGFIITYHLDTYSGYFR